MIQGIDGSFDPHRAYDSHHFPRGLIYAGNNGQRPTEKRKFVSTDFPHRSAGGEPTETRISLLVSFESHIFYYARCII